MKCPNCGSGDYFRKFVSEGDPAPLVNRRFCEECGAHWRDDEGLLWTPRRSRPAVPVELPTETGWWWMWIEAGEEWVCKEIRMTPDGPRVGFGPSYKCQPGQWIKAISPIAAKPPEPTAAEDAAMLRRLADGWNGKWPENNQPLPSEDDLRRIAARLEATGKESE